MKSITWRNAGLPLALVAGAFVAAVSVNACSSSDTTSGTTSGNTDAGGQGSLGAPVSCANLTPGTIAAADCTVGQSSYCAPDPSAVKPGCGNAASSCLAMSDNTGKATLDFRMRSINVLAPAPLQQLQGLVVTPDVDLPACQATGQGGYNWLLRIDPTANTITSGGAPPSADPINTGYCFYDDLYNGTTAVSPGVAPLTNAGNGLYTSTPQVGKVLYMPIFQVSDAATTLYVLPLSDPSLDSLTLSTDKNCIGSLAGLGDPSSCQEWVPGGSLSGYITLENADSVPLPQLGGESLCALLAGQTTTKCPRDSTGRIFIDKGDGNTASQGGDYCSTTKTSGGCGDSFWLSSTFTASAVKIDDSHTQPHCQGIPDAGGTATTTSDAGVGDAAPAAVGTSSGAP